MPFMEGEVTIAHPVRQNTENPSFHSADCARTLDNL